MAEVYEGALDRGLEGVVACTTKISFIVGATLNYRGYTIEDLAANSTFEETVFLLWNDRLPKKSELEAFKAELSKELSLDSGFVKVLKEIPTQGVHPMAWLRTAVSMMALWDKEAQDSSDAANARKALRLTAKMGLLVAAFERIRTGKDLVPANPSKSIAWNFFYTMTGKEPDAEIVKMFDTCLILHADHELNCSAFATRVTASSLSDIYSAIVSAIGALKGPLHGGANEQVMLMLKDIGSMDRARTWVKEALENKQKVMGFGHRVYIAEDPRARTLRRTAKELNAPRYEVALALEKAALAELKQRQPDRVLETNVEFWAAIILDFAQVPANLFTSMFTAARTAGWSAHILEQKRTGRIIRPSARYVGPGPRKPKDVKGWDPSVESLHN